MERDMPRGLAPGSPAPLEHVLALSSPWCHHPTVETPESGGRGGCLCVWGAAWLRDVAVGAVPVPGWLCVRGAGVWLGLGGLHPPHRRGGGVSIVPLAGAGWEIQARANYGLAGVSRARPHL